MRLRPTLLAIIALITTTVLTGQVLPIPYAHAHNDYRHRRPLLDALANGFTSVEADVHLIDGELYVSHGRPWRKHKKRTLKALYLNPLQEIVQANGGVVYKGYEGPFYLMIDIKTDAEATYKVLKEQLAGYRQILVSYQNDAKNPGAVTVFLSGNRPFAAVAADSNRLAALDGRPGELGQGYPPGLMPVVSDSYSKYFHWDGTGSMPQEERQRLQALAQRAKAEGKLLRLWGSPQTETAWRAFLDAGLGLLNADKLARLKDFSQQQQ